MKTRIIRLTPEENIAYACRVFIYRWVMPQQREIATTELQALLQQYGGVNPMSVQKRDLLSNAERRPLSNAERQRRFRARRAVELRQPVT